MVNLFYQVGYSGLCLVLLGLVAVFMAIRGTVLVFIIKHQGLKPSGIVNGIIVSIKQHEASAAREASAAQEASAAYKAVSHGANMSHDSAQETNEYQAPETIISAPSTSGSSGGATTDRELLINTLMQVQLRGIYTSMYFLKLCAAIGPLLGLLGTVLGMVDVFSTLSEKSMPDPSMLAGGIWEALLTTVMGLTLAIPALVVHFYLLMTLRGIRTRINLALSNINLR